MIRWLALKKKMGFNVFSLGRAATGWVAIICVRFLADTNLPKPNSLQPKPHVSALRCLRQATPAADGPPTSFRCTDTA